MSRNHLFKKLYKRDYLSGGNQVSPPIERSVPEIRPDYLSANSKQGIIDFYGTLSDRSDNTVSQLGPGQAGPLSDTSDNAVSQLGRRQAGPLSDTSDNAVSQLGPRQAGPLSDTSDNALSQLGALSLMELVMSKPEDYNKPFDFSNIKLYHVLLDTDIPLLDSLSVKDGRFYGATRKSVSEVLPVVLDLNMAVSIAKKLFKVATDIGGLSIDGKPIYPVAGALILQLKASSSTTVKELGSNITTNDLNKPIVDLTLYTAKDSIRGVVSADGLKTLKLEAVKMVKLVNIDTHQAMIYYSLNPNLSDTNKRLLKRLLDNSNEFVEIFKSLVGGGCSDAYERKYKKYKALYKRLEQSNMQF
jgi:hypothetical protein